MWWQKKWAILWSLWATRLVRQPTTPVLVSNGWLRGSVSRSGTHLEHMGIPYATIVNRFQAPGPEPKWQNTFEAINKNIRCRQVSRLNSNSTTGQEDCQTLNIYTPLKPQPEPLPVMVFIHGGGFSQNSASKAVYGPEYLTSKGVVLVVINYRLNLHGFLCLGIKEAPGNAGMKDQIAALKWVQRNIKAFGGDPDNVTIFGESAGAGAISYHILSPMSKGLFHKAIAQSGSSLSGWALQYEPIYLASLLAKVMGYETLDPKKLYDYFMTKSDFDLVITRVPRQEGNTVISEILYTPCVEPIIEGETPFLTELPHDLLSKGKYNKVPMIIGSNSAEGLRFVALENNNLFENVDFKKMFPKDLTFPSNETRKLAADTIKGILFGNDEPGLNNKAKLAKFYGDSYFSCPIMEETELLVKTSAQPIYSYIFGYHGWRNIVKLLSGKDMWKEPGATHADDLFYLFSQALIPSLGETEMIEKMTTMWTNFAKYGDPTPTKTDLLPFRWQTISAQAMMALFIDEQISTIPLWHSESLRFWKDLYSKYRRKLE